jgi:cytochrome c553
MPKRLSVILSVGLLMCAVQGAKAETIRQLLERTCDYAAKAGALERSAREDVAVKDDAGYSKYREAARLHFRCESATSDVYAHDWFALFYAADLYQATHTSQDVLDVYYMVNAALNELEYHTVYYDVRKAAHDLRASVRSTYILTYSAVYGERPTGVHPVPPLPVMTPPPGSVPITAAWARGARLFTDNCVSCHGVHGKGGMGPRLNQSRLSKTDVVQVIMEPQPPMPHLYPSPLSETDVEDIAEYVDSLHGRSESAVREGLHQLSVPSPDTRRRADRCER